MYLGPSLRVDATKILTRRELQAVLADLKTKARRSANAHLNLVLVRLGCCCGLRVSEIAGLQVADVRVETSRPHLRILGLHLLQLPLRRNRWEAAAR